MSYSLWAALCNMTRRGGHGREPPNSSTYLQMKGSCEACASPLGPEGDAFICSFECTFCPRCAAKRQNVCPNCGGELVPRPRRKVSVDAETPVAPHQSRSQIRSPLVWAISFAIWAFVSLAATVTIYEMYHLSNGRLRFSEIAGMEFSLFLTFIPLTPFAYAFAIRYPVQKNNWVRRSLLHLAAGLAFTLAHITLKALTPYGYWDPAYREWGSALWDSHLHQFRLPLAVFKRMFLSSVVDDITSAYVPIVIVAHAVSYYRSFRERELRASQLEAQLTKARLQTLKARLQPHFLFNKMHS